MNTSSNTNESMKEPLVVNIFAICYNEQVLIPHMVAHYKKYLPNCKITIYDNESTDNSVEIAKSLGCNVISWSSNNIIDEVRYMDIKNNCWKNVEDGWVIVMDMDEWLCVTEDELREEQQNGVTILNVEGLNMIGESMTEDLSDIDLHTIIKYVPNDFENKKLCFLKGKIVDINYSHGAHNASPSGEVTFSSKNYCNKHMDFLGKPFYIRKITNRFHRSHLMRSYGCAYHYIDNVEEIERRYMNQLENSRELSIKA